MNRDTVIGGWKQIKGKVHARWSAMIGDPLGVVSGRHTQYDGERQSAYGAIHAKSLGAAHHRAPRLDPLKRTMAADLPRSAPVLAMRAHKAQ